MIRVGDMVFDNDEHQEAHDMAVRHWARNESYDPETGEIDEDVEIEDRVDLYKAACWILSRMDHDMSPYRVAKAAERIGIEVHPDTYSGIPISTHLDAEGPDAPFDELEPMYSLDDGEDKAEVRAYADQLKEDK